MPEVNFDANSEEVFEELKDLASKYELFIDEDKISAMDASSVKIRDIKTGQLVTDKTTLDRAKETKAILSKSPFGKSCEGPKQYMLLC